MVADDFERSAGRHHGFKPFRVILGARKIAADRRRVSRCAHLQSAVGHCKRLLPRRDQVEMYQFHSNPRKEGDMTQKDYTAVISAKITGREAIDRISRVPDWWTKGFTGASRKSGDTFT